MKDIPYGSSMHLASHSVKVTNENSTQIDPNGRRSGVILSETHASVAEFKGTFGMPNLDKLSLHLKNRVSKDAKIDVVEADPNGETVQHTSHFENATGDSK